MFSENGVLQVLPVVKELELNRLKKKCDDVLLASLKAISDNTQSDLLEYLGVAERFELGNLRKFCIEESAAKYSVVDRKKVVDERHMKDKTKVKILDKMMDNMSNGYEISLKQIRTDMDKRCREIEKSRDEFMEQNEAWKTEFNETVRKVLEENEQMHNKLLNDTYQKEMFEGLWVTISDFNDDMSAEIKQLRQDINVITDSIRELYDVKDGVQKSSALDKTVSSLENMLEKTTDKVVLRKNRLEQSIATKLNVCHFNPRFGQTLTENVALMDKLEQLTIIGDEKTKMLTELELKIADQGLQHEKMDGELRRFAKKAHDVNTWVKWAKPEIDGSGRCTCFRHSSSSEFI